MDLPDPGIEPASLVSPAFYTAEPPGKLYKVASLGKNKQTGSDVLPPASAWVSFQDIMLSTRSRQEKATPCVSALM